MAASSARRTVSRVRTVKAAAAVKAKPATKSKAAPVTPVKPVSPKEVLTAKNTSDEATSQCSAAGSAERSSQSPTKSLAVSTTASRSAPTKRSLVQRVYNTIDGELTKLEKQKGLTSQDRERASRALSQMVNALEKAVEMQREMTKRKTTGGDAKSKEALAHAEDLRREIAERLERLNRKRASARRSE